MKKILFIIIFLCFPKSVLFAQNDCNCWVQTFETKGEDHEKQFIAMEASFIIKGYLQDSSPESYASLNKMIIERNNYFMDDVWFHSLFLESFQDCFDGNNCPNEIYTKIYKMNNQFSSYKDISPRVAFMDFKKTFKKQDFDLQLVRQYFLTFYAHKLNRAYKEGSDYLRILPQQKNTIKTKNNLRIYVAPNDVIFMNDHQIALSGLRVEVFEAIINRSNTEDSPRMVSKDIHGLGIRQVSMLSIFLETDSQTSYDFYIKVQTEILQAYQEVRNHVAIEEFAISYEDMMKNKEKYVVEIDAVRSLVPQKIY